MPGSSATSDVSDAQPATRPSLLYLIKQLELAVRAALDDVLRPVDLTPLQYTALTVLQRSPDLSTAELARNSFVTDQSAAGMVAVLQARGLVRRLPDPRDRRRRAIRLTDSGQEMLHRVRTPVADVEARMLASLDGEQATELRRYLVLCRAALAGRAPH